MELRVFMEIAPRGSIKYKLNSLSKCVGQDHLTKALSTCKKQARPSSINFLAYLPSCKTYDLTKHYSLLASLSYEM